jgi:hypothetical protein
MGSLTLDDLEVKAFLESVLPKLTLDALDDLSNQIALMQESDLYATQREERSARYDAEHQAWMKDQAEHVRIRKEKDAESIQNEILSILSNKPQTRRNIINLFTYTCFSCEIADELDVLVKLGKIALDDNLIYSLVE